MYCVCLLFFPSTYTTAISTLSLHDALPIYRLEVPGAQVKPRRESCPSVAPAVAREQQLLIGARVDERRIARSEEHTSELQSLRHLVCRLLLEKKKKTKQVRIRSRN